MARCEQGYLCAVCGEDVEEITDSALYLRYVMGDVDWNELNRAPETHIRCDTVLAQFIVDASFPAVVSGGAFAKECLDRDFVETEEQRVTEAYLRLRQVARTSLPLADYPLPHVIAKREIPGRGRATEFTEVDSPLS